jgi:nitrogen fixation NifU-like protein
VYSETLLEHFRAPRNVGLMRDPDAVGEAQAESCGDLARIYLRVTDERVAETRFQTYGCGPSIAAASLLTELVQGLRVDELDRVTPETVEQALGGLPEDRRHAARLAVDALRGAVAHYRRARTGGPDRV